jgi:hypothetical protein
MPIASFLNGARFDRETTRVMGLAFEMARIALGLATSRLRQCPGEKRAFSRAT